MLDILNTIQQYAAGAVAVLGSLLLLFIAPGLPITWLKKLLWIAVIIGIWMQFVNPYANDLKTIMICVLSVFVYKMLTEGTLVFVYQCVLFLVTFKLFTWLFEIERPRGDSEISHAPGFKSSKV
jgi:hypothetical protein